VSGDQPPPPGWGQPPAPPPGWGPAPTASPGWGQLTPSGQAGADPTSYPLPPGMPGAAHRPGAIPLRPLVLGDILDGAFKIIRYNPKATIGAALLVSAVAMTLPLVVGIVTGSTGGLTLDANSNGLSDSQVASLVATFGSLLIASQLQAVGLLFVSGMIAHVTSAAAVGRRLTMGEAWAATAGKRWRLFAMAVLLGLGVLVVTAVVVGIVVLVALTSSLGATVLIGIVLGAAWLVGNIMFWVRVRALAVPALMLEQVGVMGALGRSVRLSRNQFWRLLGILMLVSLIVGFAGGMLRAPFSVGGQVLLTGNNDTGSGLVAYLLLTGFGTVVSSAILQPFQAAVYALLYVDQRMRKEAYDVELLGRAGLR
jgi:hypothetical protein